MIGTLAAAAGSAAQSGAFGGGGDTSGPVSTGPVVSGGSQGGITVRTGGGDGVSPWLIGGAVVLVAGGAFLFYRAKG